MGRVWKLKKDPVIAGCGYDLWQSGRQCPHRSVEGVCPNYPRGAGPWITQESEQPYSFFAPCQWSVDVAAGRHTVGATIAQRCTSAEFVCCIGTEEQGCPHNPALKPFEQGDGKLTV